MKKVCHITSSHQPRDQRIFLKQCTSLAEKGYDVTLVNRFESFEENGVKVVGLGYGERAFGSEKSKLKLAKKAIKIVNECYKKAVEVNADIYQIHDPELLLIALKLKRKGKIVIFDSHEDYNMQIAVKPSSSKIASKSIVKVFNICQNYTLKKIDGAIFPCLKEGKHIFENKCKNIITLGNEPLLSEFYNQANRSDVEASKNNNVCYVGGIAYERGLKHNVISCYKSDATLIIAGTLTKSSFTDELVSLQEFKKVDSRGFVSRSEVLSIYNESKVGICTLLNVGQYNTFDNFATKVYEYMSVGLPVIISDYKFAREINEKYNFAILVDPENVEEISQAITYLIENPEVAKQMGENGRRAIKEEFNWEAEVEKLYDLYERL